MPASSRAGSSKAARPLIEALDPKLVATLVSKLDTEGTDDMPQFTTLTLKDGEIIQLCPDGRQCCTCIFRDSQWDPLKLMINKRKVYMHWETNRILQVTRTQISATIV